MLDLEADLEGKQIEFGHSKNAQKARLCNRWL